MKFTVNRSKWVSGGDGYDKNKRGKGDTALLNNDGYMCCLGFCLLQAGCEEKDIDNIVEPIDILTTRDRFNDNIQLFCDRKSGNTDLSTSAMIINDDKHMSPKEREKALIKLFKEYDLAIEFYGDYVREEI